MATAPFWRTIGGNSTEVRGVAKTSGNRGSGMQEAPRFQPATSFAMGFASSEAFKSLFREGMTLVEDTASYLDGKGREEARALPRMAALAYASESMRLTTRLMQVASWLLLQRAVVEGELTADQAKKEKHKVVLVAEKQPASAGTFDALPEHMRDLIARSLRLQARVLHLDRLLNGAAAEAVAEETASPVASQIEMLRMAFAAGQRAS
jgi:regulator of CtrA degradation